MEGGLFQGRATKFEMPPCSVRGNDRSGVGVHRNNICVADHPIGGWAG